MSHPANPGTAFLASEEAWRKDYDLRFRLEGFNEACHESVPVLKYIDWRITKVSRGYAEIVLPLNVESSNQFMTHQAALILVAADYTGGLALSTLLHMVPVIGFHPQESDFGAYLWGAKASIKWIAPSCDDLICKATIPLEHQERIARRFFAGKRIVETVRIEMSNGDKLVAEADFTYWCQDSRKLRLNAFDEERVHVLYDHRFKSSARLIAGLRALEREKDESDRLFDDPYAESAAGKHGVTLARRFCMLTPQIQPMVAARTKHIDDLLLEFDSRGPCQIVNIGTGLDCRPWRLPLRNAKYFELDLPLMLRVRNELLPSHHRANIPIIQIPIDLREHQIDATLSQHPQFDTALPTIIFWEGGSMYFERDICNNILNGLRLLMNNHRSRIWMDFVSDLAVENKIGIAEAEAFIRGMQKMGEPFINGFANIKDSLNQLGFAVEVDVPSSLYITTDDPIYAHYRFCLAKVRN